MLEQFVILAFSLIGLALGADFLIKGAKNIADHYDISQLFIGLTLVSVGTSIPEIGVSISGALSRLAGTETSGIVVGNAIGSALGQITLIMGILAFVVPLRMKKELIFKHGGFLVGSVLLIFILASDGMLSQIDGLIAILAFVSYHLFLWHTNSIKRTGRPVTMHLLQNIAYAIAGLALVLYTSTFVVDAGVSIAEFLGVSQSLVGLLLVGLGTGLPELSVAIFSFRHKAMSISMGNLIGSNICDLLLSLGIGTVISGFLVDDIFLLFDIPVLLFFTLLVIYFFYSGTRISKKEGLILIMCFVVYALLKVFVTG